MKMPVNHASKSIRIPSLLIQKNIKIIITLKLTNGIKKDLRQISTPLITA